MTQYCTLPFERLRLSPKNRSVLDMLQGKAVDYLWIAGGFIRDAVCNRPPSDIDLFTSQPEVFRTRQSCPVVEQMMAFHYKEVYRSDMMISYKRKGYPKIQIILRQPATLNPELSLDGKNDIVVQQFSLEQHIKMCIGDFHFTHAMFALDPMRTEIITTPQSILDAAEKKLIINNLFKQHAVDSMMKIFKYQEKGYTICAKETAKLIKSFSKISEKEIDNQSEFYWDGSLRLSSRFD
jgi:hypothetical protein